MPDPIQFAHRGAPAERVRGNTLRAFVAALRGGAQGLESDVRLTADGVPVLLHGAGRVHGRPVRSLSRAELPEHVPSLADLWQRCGSRFELALDMADPDAAAAVVELARRNDALPRLWLTYWKLPTLARWRRRWPEVKLVYATMFGVPDRLLRRTTARAVAAGVDALNLHHRLIGRNTATTVHDAGLRLFAWGLRGPVHAGGVLARGVDGVFVDRLAQK